MDSIDFQNGFLVGMATKGMIKSGTGSGGLEADIGYKYGDKDIFPTTGTDIDFHLDTSDSSQVLQYNGDVYAVIPKSYNQGSVTRLIRDRVADFTDGWRLVAGSSSNWSITPNQIEVSIGSKDSFQLYDWEELGMCDGFELECEIYFDKNITNTRVGISFARRTSAPTGSYHIRIALSNRSGTDLADIYTALYNASNSLMKSTSFVYKAAGWHRIKISIINNSFRVKVWNPSIEDEPFPATAFSNYDNSLEFNTSGYIGLTAREANTSAKIRNYRIVRLYNHSGLVGLSDDARAAGYTTEPDPESGLKYLYMRNDKGITTSGSDEPIDDGVHLNGSHMRFTDKFFNLNGPAMDVNKLYVENGTMAVVVKLTTTPFQGRGIDSLDVISTGLNPCLTHRIDKIDPPDKEGIAFNCSIPGYIWYTYYLHEVSEIHSDHNFAVFVIPYVYSSAASPKYMGRVLKQLTIRGGGNIGSGETGCFYNPREDTRDDVAIGEVICYNRVLSEAEQLNLATYLTKKWKAKLDLSKQYKVFKTD